MQQHMINQARMSMRLVVRMMVILLMVMMINMEAFMCN